MTSPFSDELISAYLDGELTAEEQARVEKQLRDDAELRRMCDELRALRFTLQAMPLAEPARDLADRVLRQAERRMLTGDEGAARVITPRTTAHQLGSAGSPLLRNWRAVAVAVASLAALVILALWLPSQVPRKRSVATSQEVPTDAAAKTMQPDLPQSLPRKGMLAESVADSLRDLPATPEDAGEAARNATTRPHTADGENGRYFREGEMKLKADGDELTGATPSMFGTAARPVDASGQETAPATNGYSLGMPDSAPGLRGKPPIAAQPEANRPEPAGQEAEAVPMIVGTAASPVAPGGNLQLNAGPEASPLTDNKQTGKAGQSQPYLKENERRFTDRAVTGRLQQESRQTVTEQLISEFDKNLVLLVQVSLPAQPREDASASLSESALGAIHLNGKAVRVLAPQLPRRDLYAVPQGDFESLDKQLAHPLQDVILVEGSSDQIRMSLANLVAQPEVQVVATNASQEQLQSLNFAMDSVSRFRGVTPESGAPMGGSGAGMGPAGMGTRGMYRGGMGSGGGMGGYGGASPSGMMPGAGMAGGGSNSGNSARQGGYPGMGSGDPSSMPGRAPQNAPRSGGAKSGPDAGSTANGVATDGVATDGVAADQSKQDSLDLEKKRPKMTDPSKPSQYGNAKAEGELTDTLRQQEAAKRTVDKPSSPTAGQSSAATEGAHSTREALGRRSKAGLDSAQSEETQSGEAASTDQQPAAREVVTYLFRLKPDAAPPAPAESAAPAKQE